MNRIATVCFFLALAGLPAFGEADSEAAFHFDYDIAPHLARSGCAAAECHGGATGRGGFKLSLFATNARADYEAITQELDGRRIDFTDPHQSLVLRKPSKEMRHKGGRVIEREGEAYRVLEQWIRNGAPFAIGDAGILLDLRLTMNEDLALVRAVFERSNGERYERDVSSLARFASTDERVATIDEVGRVSRHGPGEAWMIARYGAQSARFPIVQSFGFGAGGGTPVTHELDAVWLARLAELGLQPAPPMPDHQLLRRLYFDLCGRPPAPNEVDAFFSLAPNERVAKTVEKLLVSDEFADQLSRHLLAWFEVETPGEDLRHTSERNARLRRLTREFAGRDESLQAFAGAMLQKPPHREFVQRFGDPRDRAEFTGRALLGISIGCARCHNHPMDRWSQAQHLQFSAFFADARPVASPNRMPMAPGKFFLPGDGKAVVPALLPLGSAPLDGVEVEDRGEQLAEFLRSEAREAFSRNAANRLFGLFTGKHLVSAPDDHRPSNPALHEPVMDLLTEKFQASGFRLQPLIEFIVTSRLYAMSSDPSDREHLSGDPELRYLARREARAMGGSEFRRAVSAVLGVPVESLNAPGTPLAQQLHILNGGLLQELLRTPGNQVDAIFEFEADPLRQLEQLFLLILSRPPTVKENREFLPLLTRDPRAGGRDLAFALLAGREFSSIR